MRSLVVYLPAVACGAMMLLICVPMLLGRRNHSGNQGASEHEIAQLREEIARLKSERALDEKAQAHDG